MSEMKTLRFPGDIEPREIVDAKARENITKLSKDIAAGGSVVIEGTASDDMSEVTITTPNAWTLISEAWNSEKRPLVVLRLSDDLCAYLTSVSTMTIDGQSQGMALFSLPPVRHLGSTPPYSIWLDESGGAAILPVDSLDGADGKSAYQYAQEGGYTGTEEEFAEKLAQEPLTGTTLTLTPTQVYDAVTAGVPVKVQYFDGTYGSLSFTVFNAKSSNVIVSQRIISANGEYILAELIGNKPNGTWSFVTTTLAEKTDIPSLEGYATEAYVQNYHDNTKQDKLIAGEGITIAADGKTISSSGGGKVSSVNGKTGTVNIHVEDIHYANSPQTLDATITGLKSADAQMASDISELQTADASLDSRITVIETGDTPVTLYIYWASVVGGGKVSLTKNGTEMSVTDFISKMQSGAKIIIGENNDTDSEASGFSNYRYKITDSTTASLAFDVANSFNVSNRTIIISGSSSTNGLMTGYQDIAHDDLSDYSPLPEGSAPASKAWVEDFVDTKLADGIIIPSSTAGSTKRFKLTVDDSGAITATEVTT